MKLNILKYKRSGATSLLIVMGLALLFVGIITGLTALTVREQQQAGDTDQSNRAIQAAEASAREAAEKLVAFPDTQLGDCLAATHNNIASHYVPPNQPSGGDIEIVCRTIKSVDTTISGYLKQDDDTQIMMNVAPVQKVTLNWARIGSGSIPSQFGSLAGFSSLYPGLGGYNRPAMLEVSVLSWPKGTIPGSFLSNGSEGTGIRNQTILLVPGATSPDNLNSLPRIGSGCSTPRASGLACQAILDFNSFVAGGNSSSMDMALRITSRYRDTNFQADFINSSGVAAQVRSSEAEIDVTARSGNLYRRIKAYKPIGNLSLLDSVLGSGSEICKNLTVTTSPNRTVFRNNCGGTNY
jgi:Tfp pilus assembly protein PilX